MAGGGTSRYWRLRWWAYFRISLTQQEPLQGLSGTRHRTLRGDHLVREIRRKLPWLGSVALLGIALITIPVGYGLIISSMQSHETLRFDPVWKADLSGPWVITTLPPVEARLEEDKGVISIISDDALADGAIVSARGRQIPMVDFAEYRFLIVSVKTSSLVLAARIVLWPEGSEPITVLLKTYADTKWHTEAVDLHYFGLSSVTKLAMIDLGSITIGESVQPGTLAMYQGLMFARIL